MIENRKNPAGISGLSKNGFCLREMRRSASLAENWTVPAAETVFEEKTVTVFRKTEVAVSV